MIDRLSSQLSVSRLSSTATQNKGNGLQIVVQTNDRFQEHQDESGMADMGQKRPLLVEQAIRSAVANMDVVHAPQLTA